MGEGTRPTMGDAHRVLVEHFGYEGFRPGQEHIIACALEGHDAVAIMPTGAGKSICYQIPAALLGGLTLVISPLISLMGDQVRALKEAGIRGSYLNSSLTPRQQEVVLARALAGWYDLMYVAPERLADPRFRAFASQAEVPLVAVDEAHCVSQWGQDFRPAYRGIADFVGSLPTRPPVIALTATATSRVRADIVGLLGLSNPEVQVNGFDRPNLYFATLELTPKRRAAWICSYARAHAGESGIVYANTRKRVEELVDALTDAGVRAVGYHAGMPTHARTEAQRRFVVDDAPVMVATNAFGMGIDKSNVRYVINAGLPQSLEEYYQEAGRAGRDGEPAECYLIWCRGDIRTAHYLIDSMEFGEGVTEQEQAAQRERRERLLGDMIGYAMSSVCLRERILRHFGQDTSGLVFGCGSCSVCTGDAGMRYAPQDRSGLVGAHGRGTAGGVTARERHMRPARREDLDDYVPSEGDEQLFQRLRALRKALADERGVPPYVVFSDATLRAMVRRKPRDAEGLLAVPGVGQVKLERYGELFLDELLKAAREG